VSVDPAALKSKILEMYPELSKNNVETTVTFEDATKAWLVKVEKGENNLTTHVEEEDAAKCLEGVECVHLGTEIGRFIEYYCMGSGSCGTK
jgi:dolichyl-phosphate-mannose--protein O-mannosyl transferase